MPACLSVCLSVGLFVCIYVCMSACLYVRMYVCVYEDNAHLHAVICIYWCVYEDMPTHRHRQPRHFSKYMACRSMPEGQQPRGRLTVCAVVTSLLSVSGFITLNPRLNPLGRRAKHLTRNAEEGRPPAEEGSVRHGRDARAAIQRAQGLG